MNLEEWYDLPELVEKVQEQLDMGFFDDAKELLDQYASVFENEWEIYFLYSRFYTDQSRPAEAIPYLMQGLRIDDENADILLSLFYAHAMMNQMKKGGKFLLRAEKHHPKSEMVLSALIWYHTEINDPEKALLYFEKAKKGETSNPETYRNGGLAFDRLGRFEEAEKCFRIALQINPNFEEARDLLADHLIFSGKPGSAINLYRDALQQSPQNIRILSKLTYSYTQNNQFSKAEITARKTISLYPNSPVGYIDLAYVHLNSSEPEQAISAANKAIDISPIDPEGYRVKGVAYSEQGRYDSARKFFEKAIAFDSENVEILRDYYHHLRQAGQYDKMVETVQNVIRIEHPYCTEDYWFLADYYRESKQNLKAFHYLHLAYKSLPTEKELLPPMIDILLERGHTSYSLPFFISYVEKGGWNETINLFARNKRLNDKWVQEGIRFLRFTGQKPVEYRRFVFRYYISRFVVLFYTLIMFSLLFPAGALFGFWGMGLIGTFYGASMGLFYYFRKRKQRRLESKATQMVRGFI
ncbi:MAG: tetratricopeptide repeat protein [Chitinispirillaceae bacterium]